MTAGPPLAVPPSPCLLPPEGIESKAAPIPPYEYDPVLKKQQGAAIIADPATDGLACPLASRVQFRNAEPRTAAAANSGSMGVLRPIVACHSRNGKAGGKNRRNGVPAHQ